MGLPKDVLVTYGIFISLYFFKGNSFNIMHIPYTTIPLTPPNDTTYLFMFNCENQLGSLAANSFIHLPLLTQFDGIYHEISHVDNQAFAWLSNYQGLNLRYNL